MKKIVSAFIVFFLFSTVTFPLCTSAEETNDYCVNFEVTSINGKRAANSLVVYTPEHGTSTCTSNSGVEYAVDKSGIIVEIGNKDTAIPAEGFVVSAGAVMKNSLPDAKVGDSVLLDDEFDGFTSLTFVSAGYDPFGSTVLNYDAINAPRAENKLIIYRDRSESGTNTWGYEAVVDANGVIISVGGNNNQIPAGGFVISGVGTKKQPVIDACILGYSAVIDEAAKTVTVSYTEVNAIESYRLRWETLRDSYNRALKEYKNFDYETAEKTDNEIAAICEKMEAALTEGRINEYLKLTYSFENRLDVYANNLIPHVPVETRAIWLRIPTKSDEATVEKVVEEIYGMGFNSVCIELLFDSTTIMPVPEGSLFEQNPAFKGVDMLKLYTEQFHEKGIEVIAWMSCYRVGHDGSNNVSKSVGVKKPEWLNTDQNGGTKVSNEYGDAYFLNPALPEVNKFLLETYRYILETYPIDGFQLDYIRYPENSTVNFGYDEYTKSEFLKEYSQFTTVPVSSSQAGWKEWCQFRADYVTDFVKSVGALINEIRPDVLFSCDVAPDYASSLTKMCQDTAAWLKEGMVDVIYPMAYGTTDAVEKWTYSTLEYSDDSIQIVMGLRDNGAETYREQIIRARECGADGTAFFSYSQYIAGDYLGSIEETVYLHKAISPSYDAKSAVTTQIAYVDETVNHYIPNSLSKLSVEDIDLSSAKEVVRVLKDLSAKLDNSDIASLNDEIRSAVSHCRALAETYISEDESSRNIYICLNDALGIIEKTADNSRDDLKQKYRPVYADNDDDEENNDASLPTAPENASETTAETTAVEKTFQVLSVAIMTIGILGLPAYYLLNSRKKKISAGFMSSNEGDGQDDESSGEKDDKI